MASSSRSDNDLENKICEMSTYLDRLVTGDEFQTNSNQFNTPFAGVDRRINQYNYLPSCPYDPSSLPPNKLPGIFPQLSSNLTNVTSALASRMNAPSSSLRFVHPTPPRTKKSTNFKQKEKEPDASDIDIDTAMAELGLTPDSLTSNEVYRLFSSYKKLAFYTNAAYIFDDIYEARTLPNTMNASVQTRHAVWSSNKLLRHLRDILRKYPHVPVEYQISFSQCKQALEELHTAILKLETFKYCELEHRKGKFISLEARDNLNPLIESINGVIECTGKSRMYIEVLVWALNKSYLQENDAAVGISCGGPPHPIMMEESIAQANKVRSSAARRYIG